MNADQQEHLLDAWDAFAEEYEYIDGDGNKRDFKAPKSAREKRLNAITELLERFRNGSLSMDDFRGKIDTEARRIDYWGFSGGSQMFFNQLVNAAETTGTVDQTTSMLRDVVEPPATPTVASEQIERLCEHLELFRDTFDDANKRPSAGYVPMFLSWLWHVQAPNTVPAYYKTERDALSELNLWAETEGYPDRYRSFWLTIRSCRDTIASHRDTEPTLWELEYALMRYRYRDRYDPGEISDPPEEPPTTDDPTLWLVAAGSNSENLERTVGDPVPRETIEAHSAIELPVDGEVDAVPVWGHTSGADGGPAVTNGDVLLFYRSGAFQYAGTVIAQEQNTALGNEIWEENVDASGDTFTQIFYLGDVRPLALDRTELNAILDYAPNYAQQGFTTPNDDAMALLLEKFGSIPEFIDAVTDRDVPDRYRRMADQLESTGQVILHGPPGTGKTFHATEFAEWWINEQPGTRQTNEHVQLTTFHPSFSYEDFIEGVTATSRDGDIHYELDDGVFKRFCEGILAWDGQEKTTAADMDSEPRYVFIIDEINRGNLASILGETVTLLEADKRAGARNEQSVQLAHSDTEFSIPSDVYIIGTMNTADRSIALIDAAIRRRFGFLHFPPSYDALREEHGFATEQAVTDALGEDTERGLAALSIRAVNSLNDAIRQRKDLGRGKQLGHSYLFDCTTEADFIRAWKYELLPLLEEYFFGAFAEMTETLFTPEAALPLFDLDREHIRDVFGAPGESQTEAAALRASLRALTDVE